MSLDYVKCAQGMLAKSEGRDKLLATLQYAAMFAAAGVPGSALQVQKNLGAARKPFRVLKARAAEVGLADSLQELIKHSDETFARQISYILEQIEKEPTAEAEDAAKEAADDAANGEDAACSDSDLPLDPDDHDTYVGVALGELFGA